MLLRCLTTIQHSIVMRLLFGEASVAEFNAVYNEAHVARALSDLTLYGMISSSTTSIVLSPHLSSALRSSLWFSSSSSSSSVPDCVAEVWRRRQEDDALLLWDCAVQLVGDPSERLAERKRNVESCVVEAALASGVVQQASSSTSSKKKKKKGVEAKDVVETKEGYSFLLANRHDQMWTLLKGWLTSQQLQGEDRAIALEQMCCIGLKGSWRRWSDVAHEGAIKMMQALGLVQEKGQKWHSTPLSCWLSWNGEDTKNEGFIVVENNFRVYAYTSSAVHTRILGLFARLEYRLPNLVVGTITRKSVRSALDHCGVSARQIIHYLRANAHPRMRSRSPVLPDVVSDQLKAWEAEGMRLLVQEGILYEGFPTKEVFDQAKRYADAKGMLLWSKAWKSAGVDGYIFIKSIGSKEFTHMLESLEV